MNDTPRTERFVREWWETANCPMDIKTAIVWAEKLERENAALREAMQSAIDEISWFVGRQKDLMGDNGEGRPWSAVLDEDLNILRNALANKVAA